MSALPPKRPTIVWGPHVPSGTDANANRNAQDSIECYNGERLSRPVP